MPYFFQKKTNVYWFISVLFLIIINLINIIYNTPMVPDQHWAQKIFYVHVPSAWVGFLSYFVVKVSGIMYLIKLDDFIEYKYVIASANKTGTNGEVVYTNADGSSFTGFNTFALKIVMLSSTDVVVPQIRDMRAIALQI